MKKFLSIILTILMIVTMLPMAVLPASAAENLDYNIKLEVVDWAVYETSGKLIGEFNAVEHGDAFYDVSLTQADDGTFTCSYQIALERNGGNTAWGKSSISFKIDSCEDEFMQEFEKSFYSRYNIFYNLKVTRSAGDSHTFKDATCVAPKTCTICGVTEGDIDATAHSWANLDGICANGCGATCAHENQTGSFCEICGADIHLCSYTNGFCTECDAYEPAELKDGYYQIENGGQLFWYANYINTVDRTANAVLTADIDLENRPWTPIGATGENSNNFRGIFDGQNYFIRGLYVEGDRAGLGFFGEVRTGTVKNFTIYGEVVVNTEVDYVGGVIGSVCGVNGENDLERNGAIIQNIRSFVNLTVKAHGVGKIGGFVGYANHESLIENCSWYGTFDAGKYRVDSGAGGFIGKIQENSSEVTIHNCGAYGTIKTNYAGDYNNTATIYMGGFLSFTNTNAKTTLENCLFAGKFERGENLTDQAFLGAFGTLRSVKAIKNCYYLGDDGLEAVHSDSNLNPESDNVEITKGTAEQLKSGEIAYKLQEANEIWGQSIGTDNYPVLGGEEVYCGYTACDDEAMVYTNDSTVSATKPDHAWGEGSLTRPTKTQDGYYTYTCSVCGETKTEPVERAANYDDYTKALEDLRAYLDSDMLTDENKSYISEWLATYDTDEAYGFIAGEEETVQMYIDATAYYASEFEAAIEACLAGNHSGNGETCSVCGATLHTCDFTGEWKYDADKHWKECDCGLLGEEAEHSFTDGKCACGYACPHEWDEGVLTRPIKITTTDWDDGYYTYTCSACGHYYHETVKRADYSVLDAILEDFIDAMYDTTLLDSIRNELEVIYFDNIKVLYGDYIESEQAEVDALVETMTQKLAEVEAGVADGSALKPDYTEGDTLINGIIEQFYDKGITYVDEIIAEFDTLYNEYLAIRNKPETTKPQVDEIVEELKALKEKIDKGTEDGTLIKADYTEIDEAIAEIEQKLDDENITDEGKAGLEEIKAQLEEMKADVNTSEADLAELEKALEAYEAELDKGIADGTLVEIDVEEIVDEYNAKLAERLEAEGLLDEYEDFENNQKYTDEALAALEKMTAFLASLEGTVAENAENIAKLNEMLDSLYSSFENCLRGTHNFKDYEVTSSAKCEVNAIETGTCWFCGETDEREVEGTALSHSFTKYEVTEEAKCGVAGKEVAYCDNGCQTTDERETPALEHIFLDYVSNGDATCTADGTKTAECENGCGKKDTVADEGSKLDHVDENGDDLCDECGEDMHVSVADCECTCHRDDPLNQFFNKIIQFIRKLFGINSTCKCGTVHTSGLTPIWKIFVS